LGFEQLETRLVLSVTPLAEYDQVTPAWFADAPAPTATQPTGELARWVIRLTPEAVAQANTVAAAAGLLRDLPLSVVRGLGLPGQLLVTSRATAGALADALGASPLVADFGRDASVGGSLLPNDPDLIGGAHVTALSQYGLFNIGQFDGTDDADIDADLAWDVTTGSRGVVTAVIDSGIFYNHPDLAANIWTNSGEAGALATNGVDDDGNGFIDDLHGWDFHNNDNDPVDDHGHGTHVAGAIGAVGDNGTGVAGVNWATSLMPLKFLDQNNVGSVANAKAAINYARMMRTDFGVNVRVINASWGGAGADDPQLRAAIAAAGAADILFVAAAGNGDVFGRGQNIDELPFFPASFGLDNMLVVGATDRNDQLASFSNFGVNAVDIAAPGLSVWNTDLFVDGQTRLATYGVRTGTSMAAPLVAGTAALIWTSASDATMSEVRDAILTGGDPNASLAGKVTSGRRLNAFGALTSLPPQARITSALDVTTIDDLGDTTYQFTVEFTSNTGISQASIGDGDFVVRRNNAAGTDSVATLVPGSAASFDNGKRWTAAYQITPPGGAWDVFDVGTYGITLVAGQLVDTGNRASRQKTVDSFEVNFAGVGVFRPTTVADGGAGSGSLRDAIRLANAITPAINPNGGAVILTPGTYTLSLAGGDEDANLIGDLDITGKVTIASDGTGEVIIAAQGIDRVFDVQAGGAFQLSGVKLTQGAAMPPMVTEQGGAVRNAGTANLQKITIEGFAAVQGGGVYNAGSLTIVDSTLSENEAAHNGGGIFNTVGATATLSGSTIDHNSAVGAQSTVFARIGTPQLVNTTTAGAQTQSRVGMNAMGQAVVVWSDGQDVFAQRFVNGAPAGGEIAVTAGNPATQNLPDVAVSANGNFIVTYQELSGVWRTAARIYDASGGVINAGFEPDQSSSNVFNPEPSVDSNGNYTIIWLDNVVGDGSGDGVFARRFSSTGAPLTDQFVVPDIISGDQSAFDIAHFADGGGVAAYTRNGGDGSGLAVFGRLLDSQGAPTGAQFPINTNTALDQLDPNVAMGAGAFVVVWRDAGRGIVARIFERNGQPRSAEILVAATGDQAFASVAMLPGDAFAVTWCLPSSPGSTTYNAYVRAFDANGTAIGGPIVLNSSAISQGDAVESPWVASDQVGNVLVVWDGAELPADNAGVYAQRLSLQTHFIGGDGGGVYNVGTLNATNVTISGNEADNQGGGIFNAPNANAAINSSTITLNNFRGEPQQAYVPVSDQFRVNGATVGNQRIAEAVGNGNGRAFVAWESNETGIAETYGAFVEQTGRISPTSGSGFWLSNPSSVDDGAAPGVAIGADGRRAFGVWRAGAGRIETRSFDVELASGGGTAIMPIHSSGGGDARASINTAGKGVFVWSQDGDANIGVQLFDVNPGGAWNFVGSSFLANTNAKTGGFSLAGDVALDSQGNFVIVWSSRPSGETRSSIYMQRFNSSGARLGDETKISLAPTDALRPRVERNDAGFVVVWEQRPDAGGDYDVMARLFDPNGNPLSDAINIASNLGSVQQTPHVVLLPEGGFFAVWESTGSGDVGSDILGQQFTASGQKVRSEVVINEFTAGNQSGASVTLLAPSKLMVAWEGQGEGDSQGVFARVVQFADAATGGLFNADSGTVSVRNTIVASNSSAGFGGEVDGEFISQGGNLISDVGAASGLVHGANGNKVGTMLASIDVKLRSLADNGGPTKTHLPAADSPAIDAAAPGGPAMDQRGVARAADGDNNGIAVSDIGAVERYYASINGRKFKDQNQNGVQDAGELGIAGWQMFLDTNQNGQLDVGEPSQLTDAAGDYAFPQLDPGAYTVAEVNQPGWTRTYVPTNYASHVRQNQLDSLGVTVQGLSTVHELAMSPDGNHVYAINSSNTLQDSIVSFRVNAATGALEFIGALSVAGLEGDGHVVVSRDGKHVYALGTADNSIVVFGRNAATGALTFTQKVTQDDEIEGEIVEGILDPHDLVLSPDDKQLYVITDTGGTIASFTRNLTTGMLAVLPVDFGSGVAVISSPDGKYLYTTSGEGISIYTRHLVTGVLTFSGSTGDNVFGEVDLAISPDSNGQFLYTVSNFDQTIGVYQRNAATGALSFVEELTGGLPDSLGNIVTGLQGAKSLTMSPAGDRLYVTADRAASEGPDSIAVFRRDISTGRLTFASVLFEFSSDSAGHLMDTLNMSDGVVVSPDGQHIYVAAREGAITQLRRDGEGLDRVTLLVGDERSGLNFSSYAAPAEIRGAVYNDVDNDAARDQEELGLPGVAVYLDANSNNQFDGGESTVSTNVLGEYVFTNLAAPASYTVRLNLPVSQTVTSPAAAVGREHTIPLTPDQTYTGADFLVHSSVSGQGTSQITGFVWQDLNRDGVRQDSGPNIEPFLVGRQVYLDVNDNGAYNAGVDLLAPALTSTTGNYAFTGLGAANFVVRIIANAGELTSTPVGNTFTKQTLTTGANPTGLVSADFNGDGRPDFASADGGADKVSVRLQLPGGGFATRVEYAVGSQPTGIVVGMFNNDALPDIAVVHGSFNKVVFLINNGNGAFARGAASTEVGYAGSLYTSIAAADVDLDGDDDLAIAGDSGADFVHILRNNNGAAPSFTPIQQFSLGTAAPLSIAAGDLTGDGRAEFIVGNFAGDTVQVLRNNAGASFTLLSPVAVSGGPASVLVIPDITGDGHRDVIVASIAANAVTVLRGDGAGSFLNSPTIIPVAQGPRSVAVGDMDGDGDLDLVVGNSQSNDVVILRRQGAGLAFTFPESAGLASFSSLVASGVKQVLPLHLDNDGVLDLAAVRGNATTGSLAVLYNAVAPGSLRLTLTGAGTTSNQNFGITTAAAARPGDYNDDLDVDGADFLTWQRTLGVAANPPGSGADGSSNGTIDAADLAVWRANFGQTYAAVAAARVAATNTDAVVSQSFIDAQSYAAGGSTAHLDRGRYGRADQRVRELALEEIYLSRRVFERRAAPAADLIIGRNEVSLDALDELLGAIPPRSIGDEALTSELKPDDHPSGSVSPKIKRLYQTN
jgi:subtilisin family serine protease/6-phosphogluconolactonase (cycloisomerase 2 family)